MLQEFADRINKVLSERHDELSVIVDDGSCADHGMYKDLTGEMRGLRAAADIVRELLHKSVEFTSETEGDL